jgi:hypothetical protein
MSLIQPQNPFPLDLNDKFHEFVKLIIFINLVQIFINVLHNIHEYITHFKNTPIFMNLYVNS